MVLRAKHRAAEPPSTAMASEQPVVKKQRRNDEGTCVNGAAESLAEPGASPDSGTQSEDAVDCAAVFAEESTSQNGLHNPNFPYSVSTVSGCVAYSEGVYLAEPEEDVAVQTLECFQEHLVRQCLCGLSEDTLRRPFNCRISITEWPPDKLLVFLSNLQLLMDVYLKQNYKGSICARLMDVCDALVRNEYDWFDQVISLADHNSQFVNFIASRVVSSFLMVAKDNIDNNWLEKIIDNVYLIDTINVITIRKINFSLDVIKRVVEWKDQDQHPLEDSEYINTANPPNSQAHAPHNTVNANFLHSAASPSTSSSDSNLQSAFSNLHTENTTNQVPQQSRQGFKLHEPTLIYPPVVHEDSMPEIEVAKEAIMEEKEIQDQETSTGERKCDTITMTDSESFDTSHIKCLTIRCLEHKWPHLVSIIKKLLNRYISLSSSENCILTYLSLWENIISVKANLSVIDTKPFYKDLQSFVELLRCTNLPPLIYMQLLSLFNEVLCYGSTLALQDTLPDETCTLAHSVVRFVKDSRLLNTIRLRHSATGFGFIGYESQLVSRYSLFVQGQGNSANSYPSSLVDPSYGQSDNGASLNDISLRSSVGSDTDKTMLQKIVLLILKSTAVTVKEMRCDSSDSSIDSSDYNAIQDMQMVERSIRDVLKKLDTFLKNALDFSQESPFTKILIHLFSEQDDYLIESMVCTLDITVGIVYRNSVFPDLIQMLNPISTFIQFLEVVSHDSDILLDYLVSNETCFLLYLLRFLKYARRDWSNVISSCQWEQGGPGTRVLDKTMTVLIRLRHQISRLVSKSLFPYDISPVLRLLEVCESLYEENVLS